MSIVQFVRDLREGNPVTFDPRSGYDADQLREEVTASEEALRQSLPGAAPGFHPELAESAFRDFYSYVGMVQYGAPPDVHVRCRRPAPADCWSVDLAFHFLPGLLQRVDVPRLHREVLEEVIRRWPLSTVGIHLSHEADISGFAQHPTLLRLYVDRIIAARDRERAGHPLILGHIAGALGAWPELCPAFRDFAIRGDS